MPDRQERCFRPDFDLPGYNRLSMKFEKEIRGTLFDVAADEEFRKMESVRFWRKDAINNAAEAEKLIKDALAVSSKKIEPYLNIVNEVMAEGRGKIKLPHVVSGADIRLATSLVWDHNEAANTGSAISFQINLSRKELTWEQTLRNEFGRRKAARLNYEAPSFDKKMKDLILKIAEDPENYRYKNISP